MAARSEDRLLRPLQASYAAYTPVFEKTPPTNAQRAGLRYERQVVSVLQKLYPKSEFHKWIAYKAANKQGICQPDGLLWLPDNKLVVVEIKLTHVRKAREKLIHFYGRLVEYLHPNQKICYVQIYKNWRPACHKNPLTVDTLSEIKAGQYKEIQLLA